jgi:phosphoserine phosphatase
MTTPSHRPLSRDDLQAILGVTRALAAPFDLITMLGEVVAAAKQVLDAERGSVWLHDPATGELVLEVATGIAPVRIAPGVGLVGTCARDRRIINVPDCYADPRFDQTVDKQSGYRTRCMLTLPLIDHNDALVGVMQVLNKRGGPFDEDDEALAAALAAQCAVALQRVRMTAALIEAEKMRAGLEMAREVQMSTLPAAMPTVPGYDVCGSFRPAELTGGDAFDLATIDAGLLVVLADATGHGIAPALSVTQMQAMLRIAFRMDADLETAFRHVNNRLAETLPADRFITAFIGILDPAAHRIRFHSGGQGPILHYRAASGACRRWKPTSFPLGAMPLAKMKSAASIDLRPGDILVLLSDGYYERENARGDAFGEDRVHAIVAEQRSAGASELLAALTKAVDAFAGAAPQEDDMTGVIVKRVGSSARGFRRSFEALPEIVAFTAEAFRREGIDSALQPNVDFAVEELFTNMVKYSKESSSDVRLEIRPIEGGVEVTLTDYDVDRFDVTKAPDADVRQPIEKRRPGGLGLHLIRRLLDSIDYEYSEERRQSRITFRKTVAGPVNPGNAAAKGGTNAGD